MRPIELTYLWPQKNIVRNKKQLPICRLWIAPLTSQSTVPGVPSIGPGRRTRTAPFMLAAQFLPPLAQTHMAVLARLCVSVCRL